MFFTTLKDLLSIHANIIHKFRLNTSDIFSLQFIALLGDELLTQAHVSYTVYIDLDLDLDLRSSERPWDRDFCDDGKH